MSRASGIAGLALTIAVALAGGPAWAAIHPLGEFTVFGLNGVMIGGGSRVLEANAGQNDALVGAVFNNSKTHHALRMNGNTLIQGHARILHDVAVAATGKITSTPPNLITLGAVVAPPTIVVLLSDPEVPGSAEFDSETHVDLQSRVPVVPCPSGGSSFNGANHAAPLNLAPGVYGSLTFGSQFTLNLTAPGNYVFQSIKVGHGATINAKPGTNVVVCGGAIFGSAKVLPTSLGRDQFRMFVLGTDAENAFRIGGGSRWIGDVVALEGGIHVGGGGSTTTVMGRLIAQQIVDLEHGVTVVATTVKIPGSQKNATLLHGTKNENNGANNSLLVRYQVATLVGFDVHAVNFANVTSAILRLTVCKTPGDMTFCPDAPVNFTPHDWPAAGARIAVFRLEPGFEDWGSGLPATNAPASGNGNNFPLDNDPHGDHWGVTWNCSIDTNIANEQKDCTGPSAWNGGQGHQGQGRLSLQLLTDALADGDTIDFDVTADVKSGLGIDTTFMSWFVRRVSGPGFVAFYSVEGSEKKLGAGNLSLAPQLIITP